MLLPNGDDDLTIIETYWHNQIKGIWHRAVSSIPNHRIVVCARPARRWWEGPYDKMPDVKHDSRLCKICFDGT